MKIHFHGAAREVGRAGCLVEEDKKRVMIDYGVKISSEQNINPLPVKGFLDAVIVTHSHLDHSGAVPMLYHNSEQPCFMTPPSTPMIDLLVKDSIKINDLKGLIPIFTERHVKRMMRNVKQVSYNDEKKIGNFSFKFQDAGHILGAGTVEMQTKKHKLVYTGDLKSEDTRLHKKAYDNFKGVDVLVVESTYGDREHPERKQLEKDFVEACWEVCDNNGNVLVPAFAVGRTQEIISILNAHGFEYPIFMDGMGKAAAEIMMEYPEYLNNYNEFYKAMKECTWVNSSHERKKAVEDPSVVVSTAGMLSGGPAISYLFKMKEKEKNQAIFFSGYQVTDTPGFRLMKEKRLKYEGFDLDFKKFDIRHFDFSAHSDKHGLLDFVKKLSPKICLVQHGEEEQALAFGQKIEEELGITTIVPKFGQKVNIEDYI